MICSNTPLQLHSICNAHAVIEDMKSGYYCSISTPFPLHTPLTHTSITQIFILADTTYNSLSVDEVAASHVGADVIVHYGRASLTKLSRIPAYYVFPSQDITDVDTLAQTVMHEINNNNNVVVVIPDQVLLDSPTWPLFTSKLRSLLDTNSSSNNTKIEFADIPSRSAEPIPTTTTTCSCQSSPPPIPYTIAGYYWPSLASTLCTATPTLKKNSYTYMWIGNDGQAPALLHLQLSLSTAQWAVINPTTCTPTRDHHHHPHITTLLRRRYYLVQKARHASIVGIVVGTLGAAGYGDALRVIRSAAQRAGKKTYTLLMGKPSPAKLANFPEIEIFVLVADPQGQILDSKEYLAPIITPHEAMLAFTASSTVRSGGTGGDALDDNDDDVEVEVEWNEEAYRLDFEHIISSNTTSTGGRTGTDDDKEGTAADSKTLVVGVQAQQALIITAPTTAGHLVEAKSAADYLVHKRSWKGVEAPLVGAEKKEVAVAVAGQRGRAAGYTHEGGEGG